MAKIARDAVGVLLGEAGGRTISQRYNDMVHIASVMANRAALTGQSLQSVISARNQFSAYGKRLPPGTERLRALAEMALNQVMTKGPVTSATYYATPASVDNLPSNLETAAQTAAHVYKDDPENRAIATAAGYIAPSPTNAVAASPAMSSYASADDGASSKRGLGMAALAPNGLRAGLINNLSPGKFRPNMPSSVITDAIRDSVAKTFGPDYSVAVQSGMENPGRQHGSTRHKTGLAADIHVVDPQGRIVTNPNRMMDMVSRFAYDNRQEVSGVQPGIGFGPGYMAAGEAHLDLTGQGKSWGKGKTIRGMNPVLAQTIEAARQGFQPTPFSNPPTPSEAGTAPAINPNAPTLTASLSDKIGKIEAGTGVPAQSVQTSSFSPPAGQTPSAPDTDSVGFFGGTAGQFAGIPAQSVKTTSVAPDIDNAPDYSRMSYTSPQDAPAARAIAAMAQDTDNGSISEVANNPIGKPAPAYSTTNLPGYGYEPPAVTQAPAPVSIAQPEPVEMAPPTYVAPAPVYAPQPVAAPAYSPPAPSVPTGSQASYDFHNGLTDMAVATNGNTLSRDSLGFSYNYSPAFNTTTISDPSGRTVGVRKGFVSGDSADDGGSSGGGLFGGIGKAFSGIGDAIGSAFSGDNVSDTVMGGLGGLGGSVVGGMIGGPIGGLIGSALGQNFAVNHNPFAGPTVATFAGPMHMARAVGGLGFPSAPSLSGVSKGGGGRSISAAARASVNAGKGGLY